MSKLADIVTDIRDTEAAIARADEVVALYPDRPSLRLALASHENHRDALQKQFAGLASRSWVDVCSYRLFTDSGEPQLPVLANALLRFQSIYTLIYDAILTRKPKTVAHPTGEAVAASTFNYGFSFAGSVGFVLTLPNEPDLFDESKLDEAMKKLFQLLGATSSDQVAAFSKELGPAVIREIYKYATGLVRAGTGADINWRREDEVRAHLLIQVPELENLQQVIKETSDETEEEILLNGTLVGADFKSRTFHMIFDEKSEIRGSLADTIADVKLPFNGEAKILVVTHINFALDDEVKKYTLVSISQDSSLEAPTVASLVPASAP